MPSLAAPAADLPVPRPLLVLFLTLAASVAAQPVPSRTEGRPVLSRHVSWEEYDSSAQNWGFAQRDDGRIYAANTGGILEYDGEDWRLMATPSEIRPLIHSLAIGPSGRLYVGGIGDIGYLASDSIGTFRYRSLHDAIPEEARGFTDVWTAYTTHHGIVFQSAERLFRWNGRRMESWGTSTRFRTAFQVRDVVYVWEDGVGLKALDYHALRLIPGGDAFAERKVDALLPYGRGLLAIVRDEGLVVIEPGGATRAISGPASTYLTAFRPYAAVAVPNGYTGRGLLYAVATFGGGVVLITPGGGIVRVYGEDVGLTLGDDALGLMPDRQGGLWVALQNGITRLDLFPQLTGFSERDGILGSPNAVAEHGGTIYAGTDVGLYRQTPGHLGIPGGDGPAYSRFERVGGFAWDRMQIWDLQSTPAGLVVAAHDAVYTVERGGTRKILAGTSYSIVNISQRQDRLFVGTADGVAMLALRRGRWAYAGHVEGVSGETRFMQQDAQGALWISQPGGRLYRIAHPEAARPLVQPFGPDEGLSVTPGPLNLVGRRLLVSTRDGVFRIEAGQARIRLVRDAEFTGLHGAYSLYSPTGGPPWTYTDGVLRSGAREGFEMGGIQPNNVLRQRSGVAWVATSDGLIRYDPRVPHGDRVYPALVRRVTGRDLTVFYGGATGITGGNGIDLELPIRRVTGLRFEFAAALFDRPGRTQYQTRLLGSEDETWSPWTAERVAQFIGIREGSYTFEVRGRNDIGQVSTTAAFRLRILPPWYRTWWAYTLYLLALAGAIWAFTAWRLHKQKLRLEAARARNQRIQRLGERLRSANERLRHAEKLKDDLLSNTSHELRTPLTAILGFSEMLLFEAGDAFRDLAEGIQRGGQRLLATVDGMLDMFALQSGTVELFNEPLDAARVVRDGVAHLAPLAAARGLALCMLPETLEVPATMDHGVLNRILAHVVGNAIKFTTDGSVTVLVDATDRDVVIAVADTGVGIPAHMTEAIFEPFEQASTGFSRSHEGNGLGLAIVRGLVDLVGGSLTLESTLGVGTTVRLMLPRWGAVGASERRAAAAADNPALGGAQLLTVGIGGHADEIRAWVGLNAHICEAATPGQAVREAKKLAYDAVLIAAAEPDAEAKRVALLRKVPGYAGMPFLRVAHEEIGQAELEMRGFTHQVLLPLDADAVVTLLEALLMTIEDAVED